jgi:lysyl-tRNA synthetase class 2
LRESRFALYNLILQKFMTIPFIEENDQTIARKEHLEKLRELVGNVYPNKFDRTKISGAEDTVSNVLAFEPVAEVIKEIKEHISTLGENEKPAPELKEKLNATLKEFGTVRISGRLTTTPRTMGKAAFVHLSDGVNRLQIYVRRDDVQGIYNGEQKLKSEETESQLVSGWDLFKLLDGGDFVGVSGFLFLTNTGELSIHVETIQFLSKALLPMPDKMHGIADPELRRRYRYMDLIASSLQVEHEGLTTREVFERRAKLISGMRRFLDDHGYIEVETPMLTPKATGAAAKPFKTHHNALDIDLYARIAPELYLKRLTVGGFEKVYELNRNFRNEGLSQRHNPEFTMLEFYCAYMDVNGMMNFAETMIKESVQKATGGSLQVKYDDNVIDFSNFERLSMKDAIEKYWEQEWKEIVGDSLNRHWLDNPMMSNQILSFLNAFDDYDIRIRRSYIKEFEKLEEVFNNLKISQQIYEQASSEISQRLENEVRAMGSRTWSEYMYDEAMLGNFKNREIDNAQRIERIFARVVEENIIHPTFIIDYPKVISPLSKASPENEQIAERFELFINGMECANGFSELNDPQEQYERFLDQAKERERGDDEAMVLDEDYIRALSYGMPPAAGIGIGIDRLVMLLTNQHSIRDVILFPHMRPERVTTEESETE